MIFLTRQDQPKDQASHDQGHIAQAITVWKGGDEVWMGYASSKVLLVLHFYCSLPFSLGLSTHNCPRKEEK
jgi:hypothetical protein